MKSSQLFWQTYLNLEKEILEVAKYIYITDEITTYSKGNLISTNCRTQLETFSPLIADLLIRTCIEIEAISKELYFNFGGSKPRGDKNLFFDEDCLKLIDVKCKTHQKVVIVSCVSFNLKEEENLCFMPLKEAHKRQGTNWEKAYQALKHDRYSSISQGTVKNLLHAMGALFLLNIYYKNVKLTSKYLEISKLDFSLGSSIFSVKKPSDEYVVKIINNEDVTGLLQADESPFIMKYTDSYYKQILDTNKAILESMNAYISSQPELNEPQFIQQIQQAKAKEKINPQQKVFLLWELGQYRLNKKIPISLPFEERKKLLLSSPEWFIQLSRNHLHLNNDEITEENIQYVIDTVGKFIGIELQNSFENIKLNTAIKEGDCELVLDTGDIQYNK